MGTVTNIPANCYQQVIGGTATADESLLILQRDSSNRVTQYQSGNTVYNINYNTDGSFNSIVPA